MWFNGVVKDRLVMSGCGLTVMLKAGGGLEGVA